MRLKFRSLKFIQSVKNFIIPNSDETLRLRIGLHSGTCVAGVVGKLL